MQLSTSDQLPVVEGPKRGYDPDRVRLAYQNLKDGVSFVEAVYKPFKSRDLSCGDVREILKRESRRRGLGTEQILENALSPAQRSSFDKWIR